MSDIERELIIHLLNLVTDQQELISFLLGKMDDGISPEIMAAVTRIKAGMKRIQESNKDIEIIREWAEKRGESDG